jgi:hypothetical protein
MATGAKPALEPIIDTQAEAVAAPDAQPVTLKERLIHKLNKIFEHNERLGVTRP